MSLSKDNFVEYKTWLSVRGRCNNPNHKKYYHYGARGISVSAEWNSSFEQFLADMGKRPSKGHSIDRINTLGNYEGGNCRWATKKEQMQNRGTFNKRFTYKGVEKCLAEWLEEFLIPRVEFNRRIKKGWSVEDALETPYKKRLIARKVLDTFTKEVFKSVNSAAKKYGMSQPVLRDMLNGKTFNTTNLTYQ